MVTTSQPRQLHDILSGLKVIDSDTHYTEPPDLWTSRAPARYRERVPHLKRVPGVPETGGYAAPEFQDRWFVEGTHDFGKVGSSVIVRDGEKVLGTLGITDFNELDAASYDSRARLKIMDRLGIHAAIVYPNSAGFNSNKLMNVVKDKELRLHILQTYNDAMGEWQAAGGGRLYPQALLPLWDIPETVKEIRRCVEELKLTGFTVADTPRGYGLADYAMDSVWQPMWEILSDLDIPLNFHQGGGPIVAGDLPWRSLNHRQFVAVETVVFPMSNAVVLANFILSGLLERFPRLKLVSVESGIGWIPYVIESMEYEFDEMQIDDTRTWQRRPKEIFQDQFYACFWFEDYGVRHVLDFLGPDNIMFETDFPHPTCLYPKSQEHVADVLQDLPAAVRRKLLQDTAIKLYHLPIEVEPA